MTPSVAAVRPTSPGCKPAHSVRRCRTGGRRPAGREPHPARRPGPGDKEPKLGRPFAWTAGKTLFKWFQEALGWTEDEVRDRIYFAAVCRCFPGKKETGGDRVPAEDEIANCSRWLAAEVALLKPQLVLPVGKLAIMQFLPPAR